MEDPSSWESWTTPLPAGPVMDYPTGYQLPSPPRPGYIGDIRVLPQATPDAIRFAERLWPQRSADGFEQRAKRWVERTTGNEYARVRGNPLMGDDARVADLFLVVEDSLIFLSRTEEQATSRPLGSTGGWRGRCRNPLIISCGDWRSTPPEFWGTRDWEEARGNGQPLNPSLPPAPPQLTLSGFTLFASSPKPERRSDRSRAADAALHRFGVR